MTRNDPVERATSAIARGLSFARRRGRLLARPSGWLWGARWAALTVRWHAGRPVTVPHYYNFGSDRRHVGEELVRPNAWDALRTETHGPFALPATRVEWEREADQLEQGPDRARAIDGWLRAHSVASLASYGVGGASLELWLHRLSPERRLQVTEYAPATVARLATVFPEAEVRHHDLLADVPLDADLHFFSRIDTEFSDDQWRAILRRFSARRILVATEVYYLGWVRAELRLRQTDPNATWAGWLRNRAALEALWRSTHRPQFLRLGDLDAWVLEPAGRA